MALRRRKPVIIIPLTKHDRCDRCGTEGRVRLVLGPHDLVFCAHHYAEHADALLFAGWQVNDDQRAALTARPADVRGA
jgi:hypothetical protein